MFVCFLFPVLVADDFRIFCGDLGNEVNDDILARAFSRYPSFLKAKVGSFLLISANTVTGVMKLKNSRDCALSMLLTSPFEL